MTDRYDAIVVGAGHNGLVCSALLAKAGKRVLVLEAKDQVGGAAITRSFAAGYSVSACAHLLYQLQPKVRKDLGLKIEYAAENMETIALSPNGQHVRITGNRVDGVSDADTPSSCAQTSSCTHCSNRSSGSGWARTCCRAWSRRIRRTGI